MGLFSSTPEPEPSERSKRSNRRQIGPILVILCGLVIVFFTGYVLVTLVAVLIHERRRVRARWYLLWAAVTGLIAFIATGATTTWLGWNLAEVGSIASRILPHDPANTSSPLTIAADFANRSFASAFTAELIAAAPLAMLTAALIVRYRRYGRTRRGIIEGPEYTNMRPVGILDRARITRERRKIAAGHYMPPLPELPTIDELRSQLPSAVRRAQQPGPAVPSAELAGADLTERSNSHEAPQTEAEYAAAQPDSTSDGANADGDHHEPGPAADPRAVHHRPAVDAFVEEQNTPPPPLDLTGSPHPAQAPAAPPQQIRMERR